VIGRLVALPFGGIWKLKQRCASAKTSPTQLLCRFLYNIYQADSGSSIAWNSEFAGEPCFPHGMTSIFISGGATIGKNCVIFQQVTIGSNALADSRSIGAPSVGDNCYIAAGAKIVGKVHIGNNVRIGANAVVYQDVADNSVIVSNNQRVVTKEGVPDNRFYTYRGHWMYFDNGKWVPVTDSSVVLKLEEIKHT
jgi:serine O-acetyltransferase